MKELTIYEAEDGKRFNTKEECEIYEAKQEHREHATAMLRMLQNFCREHECEKCAFNCKDNTCFFEVGWAPIDYNIRNFEEGGI